LPHSRKRSFQRRELCYLHLQHHLPCTCGPFDLPSHFFAHARLSRTPTLRSHVIFNLISQAIAFRSVQAYYIQTHSGICIAKIHSIVYLYLYRKSYSSTTFLDACCSWRRNSLPWSSTIVRTRCIARFSPALLSINHVHDAINVARLDPCH
jgi:hypothetical protein